MGVPMSTSIAIAGIRKRNSHALRNDAMSGVWIRKLGRSISGANSSNNPEYAGKFWLYDNNQLIEQEPFEQPNTDNEPFAQQFFDEGLHTAALSESQ